MKVGYRRYSGKAYISEEGVRSKRGAWLEKRRALFAAIEGLGHEVVVIENGDAFMDFPVVFVEFGSLNTMFHEKDISFSEQIMRERDTIFLLDDPDLFPKKARLTRIWVNGDAEACSRHWGKKCETFPFYGLQEFQNENKNHNGKVIYYGGTSGGRLDKVKKLSLLLPEFEVCGSQKEYSGIRVKEPPSQTERATFYNQFMGCISLTDSLHKKLNWNTGRKWHAICAGCPVIEDTNPKFFEEIELLKNAAWRTQKIREQQEQAKKAFPECQAMLVDSLIAELPI